MPTPLAAPRPVAARLTAAVAALSRGVESTGRVASGPARYDYLSDVDVTAALRPALAAEGVIIVPTVSVVSDTVAETQAGRPKRRLLLSVAWTAIGADGDTLSLGATVGEAEDTSDKGAGKAMTHARKYLVRLLCCLATGEDPDAHPADAAPVSAPSPAPSRPPSRGGAASSDGAGPPGVASGALGEWMATQGLTDADMRGWAASVRRPWPPEDPGKVLTWLADGGGIEVVGRWLDSRRGE